ncbi:hypothetical protein D7I39_07095 [Allopusillimonas ginsengisoli]|nr:hypothetical protein D7I39_07095 [Allopusillimonas ginsengisoli]
MKIYIRLGLYDRLDPDPWDDSWGTQLPHDHIICREVDGTPHSIYEYIWPWTAYSKDQRTFSLHFFYWNQKRGPARMVNLEVSPERETRIRELQFLMTRQLYYGNENGSRTLASKLETLHFLARFAEARSCAVRDVLTEASLLDACGARLPNYLVKNWAVWIRLLRQLDPVTQLGFTLAVPKRWKDLERRTKKYCNNSRQFAPLPTRIYGGLIKNLSAELDDIEAHSPRLLAALRDALVGHAHAKAIQRGHDFTIGPAIIEKHGLGDYLVRRGFNIKVRGLHALS